MPEFLINQPFDGQPTSVGNENMVALAAAASKIQVDKAYGVVLRRGAHNEGQPGARPRDGAGGYGDYFRDLNDNKINIAYHGDIN